MNIKFEVTEQQFEALIKHLRITQADFDRLLKCVKPNKQEYAVRILRARMALNLNNAQCDCVIGGKPWNVEMKGIKQNKVDDSKKRE